MTSYQKSSRRQQCMRMGVLTQILILEIQLKIEVYEDYYIIAIPRVAGNVSIRSQSYWCQHG